jgi:diguanylate cyclase (GGDEF)-like protein
MKSEARAQELIEVEEALAHKGLRLRFVPRLEAAYEAVRGPARNRAIRIYLLLYMAAKLVLTLANLQASSRVFLISLLLRLGVVLPLTLLAVYLLRRPLPQWAHAVASFTPLVLETSLVLALGRLAPPNFGERYFFIADVGIFTQTLLMPAPFRYSACGLAAALASFGTLSLVRWPGVFGPPFSLQLLFVVMLTLPALFERYNRERAGRRNFLLHELNRLRIEHILRMNAHLERLSSLDGLTGIFNRRYLDAALERLCAVAAGHERWIAILMIDIDHFKSLNDTAGHQHGDFCLERVAQILQHAVRAGVDTVARYGGEEFVAILPDADEQEAIAIGERVRSSIEAAALPGADGRVVTVSAGAVAVRGSPGTPITVEELVATADQALYKAKKSGRNRVIYADEALHSV